MPVTADQPAPYAPAKTIIGLVERHRNRGLPSPVDADVLIRAGVPESLVPRTLQAMQTLDLVTDDWKPSQALEGMRLAPEPEFKHRMAEWLNAAYADVLAFVDPATDKETQIRDAFRNYKPVGQQERMVSLFVNLFTAAGVMPERDKQRPAQSGARRQNTSPSLKPRLKPTPRQGGGAAADPVRHRQTHHHPPGLPPALAGLLQSLPTDGQGWTKEQRDRFMTAFPVVLDYSFPIVEPEEVDPLEAVVGFKENGD